MLLTLVALVPASGSPPDGPRQAPGSGPPAAVAGAVRSYTPAESTAAVRALRRAILVRDPGQARSRFRVAEFRATPNGYRVTLVPDRPSIGGGGRAFVMRARRVRGLDMFR